MRSDHFQDETSALFTGSRVYGTPKDTSDLDLCLLVTDDEYNALMAVADRDPASHAIIPGSPAGTGRYHTKTRSFRFGRLNVLATTDEKMFQAWQKATTSLKTAYDSLGSIPRDLAVNAFLKYEREVK